MDFPKLLDLTDLQQTKEFQYISAALLDRPDVFK